MKESIITHRILFVSNPPLAATMEDFDLWEKGRRDLLPGGYPALHELNGCQAPNDGGFSNE